MNRHVRTIRRRRTHSEVTIIIRAMDEYAALYRQTLMKLNAMLPANACKQRWRKR